MCLSPIGMSRGRLFLSLLLLGVFSASAARLYAQTITVTSPNGGEVWEAATGQLITWNEVGCDGQTVEISLLYAGEFQELIGITDLHAWAFEWTSCEFIGDSNEYTVRIVCTDCDPPVEDVSDGPFEIYGSAPVPMLEITSPLGGEVWPAGTTQTVTWDCTDPSGYVEAWLLKGDEHHAFIGHVPMSNGAIVWDVSPLVGDGSDYSVRLTWFDTCGPEVQDFNPAPFTIAGSSALPTLTVTSPNGGEVWLADMTETITWESTDPSGDVEIWLIDSDTRYDFIGSAPTADGELDWPILPCVGDANDLSIVVRWSARDQAVEDVSDAPFEIAGSWTPELIVTSPLLGEVWAAGTLKLITWMSSNLVGDVELDLYEAGSLYAHLGRAAVSDGMFIWDVCPGIGDGLEYTVRLSMGTCGVEAFSDPFEIFGSGTPSLTLISPAGGESWAAGAPHQIIWDSENLIGNLHVYVPNDGAYQSGHAIVPVTDGSFTWPIAPTLTWPIDPNDPATVDGGVWLWSYDCGPVLSVRGDLFEITESVTPLGDIDGDYDLDLHDLAAFQRCFTGRGPLPLDPVCDSFDFEPDGDVDIDEFAELADSVTGP